MHRLVPRCWRRWKLNPRRPALALFFSCVIAASGHLPTHAEEVLDYLPEDALGFVLVRDVKVTSERFQFLAHSVGVPLPGPLEYFKSVTNITAGLDEGGDALVALLPGSRRIDAPQPMVLLPISNYDEFSASIQADPSGKLSSVELVGEKILVARQGPFAMLMNPEHRETLKVITSLEPSPVEMLGPWSEWLAEKQISLVVMPEGRNWIRRSSKQLFSRSGSGGSGLQQGLLGRPEIAGLLGQLRQGAPVYQAILEGLCTEFEAVAYGLEVDEQANIRFGKRAMLNSDMALNEKSPATIQLAGFGDGQFMFAGGSALPTGALEKLIRGYSRVQQRSPELWDLGDLSPDQWQAHEDATVNVAKHIKSMRFLLVPGEKEEPLLSNLVGVLQVDDAAAFRQAYKAQVAMRNQVLAQSTSDIQLKWEIADTTIADLPAIEESLDVATAAADPDLPIFNWMIEAALGKDGKLELLWVQTDDNQIVCGMCEQDDITNLIKQLKAEEKGLGESKQIDTTRNLLPKESAGLWFISLQGCAQWANRCFEELLEPVFGFSNPQFELPESPPIGFSLDFPKNQIVSEIVWPRELTQALLGQ